MNASEHVGTAAEMAVLFACTAAVVYFGSSPVGNVLSFGAGVCFFHLGMAAWKSYKIVRRNQP